MLDETAAVLEQESPKTHILNYFVERSGLPLAEIERRLGSITELMDKPLEDAIPLFIDPANTETIATFKHNNELVQKYSPTPNEALAVGWRDLLTYKLIGNGLEVKPEDEPLFEVVANNGLANINMSQKEYYQDNWEFKPFSTDMEQTMQQIQKTLKPGESMEQRLTFIQGQLEKARKLGLEIITKGEIPLLRTLFFEEPEQIDNFLTYYSHLEAFQPKHPEMELENRTLRDVIQHTEARPLSGSPLDSWTYAAPNSRWFFGHSILAEGQAVMMVTGVKKEDLLWTRMASSYRLTGELWRTYEEAKPDAAEISKDTKLTDLAKKGKRGMLMCNEGEATLWGPQVKVGLIDFRPKT